MSRRRTRTILACALALAVFGLPAGLAAAENAANAAASADTSTAVAAPAVASNRPVIRVGFDDVEVGAMVLYRVGPTPAPGVVSREPYKIRYELLRLTAHQATLARTTLSLTDRELAREIFSLPRYPRATRQPGPAPAHAAETAVACTVAGQKLDARRVLQTWQVNGRPSQMEWLLSPAVPLTGLVAAKIDGADQLQLLAFSRGGELAAPALAAAATAATAAARAQATAAATSPADRPRNRTADLPPGTLIVDPRSGVIFAVPQLEIPSLPAGDFDLEGAPATPATPSAPADPAAPPDPAPSAPSAPSDPAAPRP